MSNIFLISDRLGAEDRLTCHWAYVLNTVPKLGQRVVDQICRRTGLPETEFVSAIDHPEGTQRDRPDFQIKCADWSMLFEHKLVAGLGPAQLERYLEHVTDRRRTYLALMAPRLMELPTSVLRHARYRRPKGSKHFLWQDFFPLIERSRSKLAQDFGLYLGALGVQPWQWGRLGDPFTNPSADAALREVFEQVAGRLREPGRQIIPSRTTLGFEIRKPLPHIHLSYVYASPSIEDWDERVQGRALTMSVWTMRRSNRRILRKTHGYLRGSDPRVFVDHASRQADWKPYPYHERLYMTSLPPILGRSPSGAADRITAFVKACFGHLQGRGYLVEQARE